MLSVAEVRKLEQDARLMDRSRLRAGGSPKGANSWTAEQPSMTRLALQNHMDVFARDVEEILLDKTFQEQAQQVAEQIEAIVNHPSLRQQANVIPGHENDGMANGRVSKVVENLLDQAFKSQRGKEATEDMAAEQAARESRLERVRNKIRKAWQPAPLKPRSSIAGTFLWSSPPIPQFQKRIIIGAAFQYMMIALGLVAPVFTHGKYIPKGGCDQAHLPEPKDRGTVAYTFMLCGDKNPRLALLNTLAMIGATLGVLFGGALADSVGRYKTSLFAAALISVSMFTSALAPEYWTYAISRLLTGFSLMMMSVPAFAIATEWAPKEWRVPIGVALFQGVLFPAGELTLVVLAKLLKNWRIFMVATASITTILAIFGIVMMKKSPLWLATQPGREQEANDLLMKGGLERDSTGATKKLSESAPPGGIAANVPNADVVYERVATWAMAFLWFTLSMGYYGISLGIGGLGGDLYLNSALCSLSEMPACLLATYLIELPSLGRRLSHCMFLMGGGISCSLLPVLASYSMAGRICSMFFGKLCFSAAFAGVYSYTSELYAARCRGKGMSLCSAVGRTGSLLAPVLTSTLSTSQFYIICAVFAFTATAVCRLALPETGPGKRQKVDEPDDEENIVF